MESLLQLRYRSDGKHRLAPTASVAGILISGDSPADWLNTVTHWGLGTESLRVLVIDECRTPVAPPTGIERRAGDVNPLIDDVANNRINGLTSIDRHEQSGSRSREENNCPSAERRVYGTRAALIIGASIPSTREEFERLIGDKPALPVLPLLYRCVADRLYVPIDAELTPHVSEAELRALLPSDAASVLVWHPAAGLIQFEPDQIPTIADLLGAPTVADASWDAARFGEVLNDRIHSLHLEEPESLNDIIQQGRDDIGTDAGDISNAPPSPDEDPHPRLNDLKRNLQRMIANGILGITGRLPERPNGSQTLSKLHQWAASMLSGLAAGADAGAAGTGVPQAPNNLSTQRENEIKRLLNMLQEDPDQGLRYALPLHGGTHRGQAMPSGRLGERTPNFDLGQLGGSRSADSWELPWEYHVKLMQSYRDLAQREMRLGNHRRAAYIYATLLGDLNAAATALETGGLHRDAATLYQKHLNNPLKAAECLRNGGFWEDALIIYRDRGRWIEAGELHLKLDQPEEARVMFSNEVRSCEARCDFLRAGELADQRLQDPEQAASLWAQGWDLNASGEKCFRALLDLHGRRGQHALSRQIIQKLAGGPNLRVHQRTDAVRVCSDTAVGYPDAGVRDFARRQTWQIASAVLQDVQAEQHPVALAAIRTLSKPDELLQRDAQRFGAQLTKTTKSQKAATAKPAVKRAKGIPQPKTAVKSLVPVAKFQVSPANAPVGIQWRAGIMAGGIFCLVAEAPDGSLVLFQMPGSRAQDAVLSSKAFILHVAETPSLLPCQLRPSGIASRAFLQQFPASSNWNKTAIERLHGQTDFMEVLAPQCDLLLDFMQLPTGTIWALFVDAEGRLAIEAIGLNGLVRQTVLLDLEGITLDHFNDHLYRVHCDGTHVFVVSGRHVWRVDAIESAVVDKSSRTVVKPTAVIEFPESPKQMVASPMNTTLRLAFSFQNGAQVVWPLSNESCAFATGFAQPLICCTANGLFIAACSHANRLAAYRLNAGSAEQLADFADDHKGGDPIVSLLPAMVPNEFFALHHSGRMVCLQIPVR